MENPTHSCTNSSFSPPCLVFLLWFSSWPEVRGPLIPCLKKEGEQQPVSQVAGRVSRADVQHGPDDGYAQPTAGGAIWRGNSGKQSCRFYSQFSSSSGASAFYPPR